MEEYRVGKRERKRLKKPEWLVGKSELHNYQQSVTYDTTITSQSCFC